MTGVARPTRGSLRRRATLASLAVAIVSVVVVLGVFIVGWLQFTLALRTQELTRQVKVVASGLEASSLGGDADPTGLRARLLQVESGLIGARLVITDGSGAVVHSTAGDTDRGPYPVAEMRAEGGSGDVFYSGLRTVRTGGRVLVVASRLAGADRYLLAVQPVREINQSGGRVLGLLVLSAGIAVAVAWAAGAWLARRVTGPVVRLTRGARAVSAGDWGHQVPVEGDDEVAELAGAFNDMSTRVAGAYRAQKEFVGDVSHELRTPITSIRGFSEALMDGTITDAPARERAYAVIHDEAGRIGELTATLLSLAELDAGTVEVAREAVDAASLAEALEARFGPRAEAGDRRLEIGPLEGTPAGDRERLLQAVSALVENALTYTPAGEHVRVTARPAGRTWRLAVDDSGPGIPVADRERVFGRLTRLDSSRSADVGGSGLGLAICRRLVELMGGTVWVEDSDLGGARFVVELPAA
jgi:signal transduction histidine kinase